jgi:hypothetical protein
MSLQLMTKFFKPTEKIQSQSENVTNLNNEVMTILEKVKTPTDPIKNRKESNAEAVEFGQLPSYKKYKQLIDQTNWKQFDILVKEFEKKTTKGFV